MTESLESQAALLTGQLEAVRRLSTLAVAPLSRDELLEKILDTVLDVAGAEAGSLAFVDPDTEQLQFAVVRGPAATTLKDVVLEPGEGIIGWSVQHRQPAIVPDTSTDERFAPRVDQLVQFVTRSVVVCPMVLPDRVIGAIELVNKRGLPSFTQPDADLLQTAATAAALVVDNCRLKA
ncbi:MAG: GAF domain-containing protein, partial [Armatimonadetes bacterium]|nr:GAF domain-containing protein [Armatimonadota bacterium]